MMQLGNIDDGLVYVLCKEQELSDEVMDKVANSVALTYIQGGLSTKVQFVNEIIAVYKEVY